MGRRNIVIISYSVTNWFSNWYVRQKLMFALSSHVTVIYTNPRIALRDCASKLLRFNFGIKFVKINSNLYIVQPPYLFPKVYKWPFVDKLFSYLYHMYLMLVTAAIAFGHRRVHYVWEPFAHVPPRKGINDIWVYHPYDYFKGYKFYSPIKPKLSAPTSDEPEDQLISKADLFYTVSDLLSDYYHKTFHRRPELVENGVGDHYFELTNADLHQQAMVLLNNIPQNRVAYSGSIDGSLDLHTVIESARQLPDMTFVFIGPIRKTNLPEIDKKVDELFSIKNVIYLGQVSAGLLPYLLSQMDALMFCYSTDRDLWTHYSGPAKLFEYLSMGKPIFSPPHPVVSKYSSHIHIAACAEDLVYGLRHREDLFPLDRLNAGINLAKTKRWTIIADKVLHDIQKVVS